MASRSQARNSDQGSGQQGSQDDLRGNQSGDQQGAQDDLTAQRAATGDQRSVDGPQQEQPLRAEVNQSAEELGLDNAVKAAAGRSTADGDTNSYRPDTTATGDKY
jgi:hypothetical protein